MADQESITALHIPASDEEYDGGDSVKDLDPLPPFAFLAADVEEMNFDGASAFHQRQTHLKLSLLDLICM